MEGRRDIRRALEALPEPALLVDLAGAVQARNAAARALDPAQGPLVLRTLERAPLPPEEAPAARALRTAQVVEARLYLEQGTAVLVEVEARAVPLFGREGALEGALLTLRPVDAGGDLGAEDFRHAFDLSDDVLCLIASDGQVLKVNEGAQRALGWPREAWLGFALTRLVHPEDLQRTRIALDSREPRGNFICRLQHLDGRYRLLAWTMHASPARERGAVAWLRGVDVTDTLRREEELITSREELAEAQDIANVGILSQDLRTGQVHVTRRLRALLELGPEEPTPEALRSRVTTQDLEAFDEALAQARGGVPAALQLTCRLEGGNRTFKVWIRLHRTSGRRLVTVVQDVSEEVKLTAQLRLSERMAALGTLAAGVAHEINNPLAFLTANVNSVRTGLGKLTEVPGLDLEDSQAALTEALEGARRIADIVSGLRSFSRVDADRPPAPCDVPAVLEAVLDLANNETRHRAQVVRRFEPVPPVMAQEARLAQVFLNLVLNAAEALPDGHAEANTLSVRTRAEGRQVVVEFQDTGRGIDPALLPEVFDPFFTLRGTGRGSGLGLFIAQGIVRELQGTLTVESQLGAGSTFTVRLPAWQGTPPGARVPRAAPVRDRLQVLVVDDEPLILRSLQRSLSPLHEVTTVPGGAAALETLRGRAFDLLLCDLMMPQLSGVELWERLAPELRSKVVFMTGGTFTEAAQAFLDREKPPLLFKPFSIEAFQALLRERRLGA